jgi:transcription initiation factor TFIIB
MDDDTHAEINTRSIEEDVIRNCLYTITPWASSGTCIPTIKEDDNDIYSCFACGSVNPEHMIEGRCICPDCGIDNGSVLECNTTGRTTDKHNTNIERVGTPIDPHLPKSSMGTSIRWSRNSDMNRLRRFQSWGVMPSSERGLYQVYKLITTHCSKEPMAIPKKAQYTAKNMYHIIAEHYKTRGAKRIGLIAACIYYACKMEECPRDPSAIAERFCIRNKDISCGIRTYQTVTSGIDHPIFRKNELSTSSDDFIGRYCTILDISDPQVMRLGQAMCKKITSVKICDGYTPTTVALSVLSYIMEATKQSITHREFCKITDVSPGTISRCKRAIQENETAILPKRIVSAFQEARKS